MTPTNAPETAQPALLRHIVPVAVGGAVALMLTIVTDNMLAAHGVLGSGASPSASGPLLLIAAYRGLFAVLGCHVAARIAPEGQPRIRYALALGMIMLVLNIIGAASNWGRVPAWYLLGSIAMTLPYAILGGGTAVRVIAKGTARTNG